MKMLDARGYTASLVDSPHGLVWPFGRLCVSLCVSVCPLPSQFNLSIFS